MNTRRLLLVLSVLILSLFVINNDALAQTTGKIKGNVQDAATGEPLPAANVLIDGTTIGAATDSNGDFYIINVSPGKICTSYPDDGL